MTPTRITLAAALLGLPLAAQAQPVGGLYVSTGIGVDVMSTVDLPITQALPPLIGSEVLHGRITAPKPGVDGRLALGWGYNNGWRAEIEAFGIGNAVRFESPSITYQAPGFSPSTSYKQAGVQRAHQTTYGGMLNGVRDFDVGSVVTPYVGLGIGLAAVTFPALNQDYGNPNNGNDVLLQTRKTTLGGPAAQLILGASYPVSPNLALTLEYRVLDILLNRKITATSINGGEVPGTGDAKVGNIVHQSLNVGLRYSFGAAPIPAPAPVVTPAVVTAPAPAPARSYLVFFDWDKSDLTARAQQIIAEAARNATRVNVTRIDVSGHADLSGTPAYNLPLSLARANHVAAELVRLGVPKGEIVITAFGDTKPLVKTASGVREPQNRRVEIVLH